MYRRMSLSPMSLNTPRDLSSLGIAGLEHLDLTGAVEKEGEYPISGGALEDIWRGRISKTGQLVAIRAVRAFTMKERALKAVVRELKIWSTFNHPNIIPLIGYTFEFGAYPAFICPWILNGNLTEYMKEHPDVDIFQMVQGIAQGMQYLHEHNVVHSDLKANNVMVSDTGEPLLSGFALTRYFDYPEITNTFEGAIRWSAPELLLSSSSSTKETDVWAFGMTVYEILTGNFPYRHIREHEALVAITRGVLPKEPPDLDNCSGSTKALWDLCQKCWQTVPSMRPSAKEILLDIGIMSNDYDDMKDFKSNSPLRDLTSHIKIDSRSFASGGFADIYSGTLEDEGIQLRVAVKFHRKHCDPKSLRRVYRECAIWAKLSHLNVVPFLGTELRDDGAIGLVSPFYELGDLHNFLYNFSQNPDRRHLIQGIADGVAYLHSLDIVHGDLKPTNVLVSSRQDPCLVDFGLSRSLNPVGFSQEEEEFIGNARYSAPELLGLNLNEDRDFSLPTFASDVYAFSMVMFEISTNSLPFEHCKVDMRVMFALTQHERPARKPDRPLSDDLWGLLCQCWSDDPAIRPGIHTVVERLHNPRFELVASDFPQILPADDESNEDNQF